MEQIKEIFNLIKEDTITPKELKEFLVMVLTVIKKSKDNFDATAKENLGTIKEALEYIESRHNQTINTVNRETTEQKEDFDAQIKEIKNSIEELKSIEVKDGKDADEDEIVEKVLSKIEFPEIKDVILDTGEEIVDKINALPVNEENQIDASHIKNLPEFTKRVVGGVVSRNLYQLGDVSLTSLANNDTLKWDATDNLWKNGVGGGGASPLTTKGDIYTYSTTDDRLGVGEDGQVLTADSTATTGLSWEYPETPGNLTFMFANVASDISTYYNAVSLSTFVVGTQGDITTAGVSTTPALLGTFATEVGYPGIINIPAGIFHLHYETEKVAGANNYYTYAEVYKRAAGGTETLLLTSDNSTQTASNTVIQHTVGAPNAATIPLLSTDRIVVKIYGVMVSSTATIHLYFDNGTDARLEMPSPNVDASNFIPYTGATADFTTAFDINLSSETASTIASFDASKNIKSLSTGTYPSLTELSYVKGVTSSIQTQLNAKGIGDMLLGTAQTVTGAKTFNDTKLLLRNVADTFSGSFTNTNTADRIYTLRDATGTIPLIGVSNTWSAVQAFDLGATVGNSTLRKNIHFLNDIYQTTLGIKNTNDDYAIELPSASGTIALTSDITGTNSGTNTGDQTITNSSDATSHTVTLSASGGSVQLIEGSNITLTTGGTGSAGTVTIAATGSSGDMVLASVQTVTGLKTFDKDKLAMKGTSTGVTTISTANAGASDYTATLQAASGTIAYLSDISGTSGITRTVVVTSGSVTMGSTALTDYIYFVAGAHTMSLPAAAGNTDRYTVKNNHSVNITIDTVGAETIEGAASISIAPQESVDILSDGTNYYVL